MVESRKVGYYSILPPFHSSVLFILFFFPLLWGGTEGGAFSQSLSPVLVGSTGNYSTAIFGSISSSVGEPVVQTFTATGTPAVKFLTQGFQQPNVVDIRIDSIIIGPSTSICFGSNVTISATVSNGIPPYTYYWAPAGSTTSAIVVSPTVTTSYTLVVSDQNTPGHNKDTAIKTITVIHPVVTISANPNTSICAGSSVTLSASATAGISPYTYHWLPSNNSTNSLTVTPTSTSTYTVVATDNFSCTTLATKTVTVNPIPTLTVTASPSLTICHGSTATLTASGATNYVWSPNPSLSSTTISNPVASPTGNTTYTVSGTSLGCTGTKTVSVTVVPSPTVNATASSASICNGNSTSLTASGASSYVWAPANGGGLSCISCFNPVANPTTTTVYTLTGSIGSCADTTTLTINVSSIAVSITGNNTACVGSSNTLTATASSGNPPYTYLWNPAATTQVITPTYTSPGINNYSVTVTDGSGCMGSHTFSVTVNAAPSVTISASNNVTTLCTSGSVLIPLNTTTLTATSPGAISYLWSPGAKTTQSIQIGPNLTPSSTTYTVETTNAAGCKGVDTIHINVISNPYLSPVVSPVSPTYCLGDSIQPLTVTNTYLFTAVVWSNAMGGNLFVGNPYQPPQNLPVGITSGWVTQGTLGCFADPSSVSITINPTVNVTGCPDITICPGFTAQLSATAAGDTTGLIYEWWLVNSTIDSMLYTSPNSLYSVHPDTTTYYLVRGYNAGSCYSEKDTVWVFVSPDNGCEIHIYNGITPNGDGSNDAWWIDGIQSFPDNLVVIFNRWGTKVWEARHYDNDKVIWRGTSSSGQLLPDGTYYYIVELYNKKGEVLFHQSKWVEVTR